MAGGRCADRAVHEMRQAIRSFGFTVVVRHSRIFVIWPGAEEVYICRKLARMGYWEINKVDRNLWELYGAQGICVHEFITTPEAIKWFYDLALTVPEIIEGLALSARRSGSDKIAERIGQRFKIRDYKQERKTARQRKRNSQLTEAENNDRKRQEKGDRTGATSSVAVRRQS